MRREKANVLIGLLTLGIIVLLGVAGWLGLKSLPSRYLAQLPQPVQNLVIPEQENVLLPTVAASEADAAALIAVVETPTMVSAETTPTATPSPIPSATATATPTPIPTPTSVPNAYRSSNITYHQQDWNNCGPATVAMAMSMLGPQITQYDATPLLKPSPEDRNVSPYEMAGFVNGYGGNVQATNRVNGSLDLLKLLIANDFPVIIEVGDRAPSEVAWVDSEPDVAYRDWWGHYLVAAGYDDAIGELWVYNSLIWDIESETNSSAGQPYSYEELLTFWPQFNSSYIVLYPPERLDELNALLGDSAEPQIMWQQALEKTQLALQNRPDDPFLWFNLGTIFVEMEQYDDAATAYDKARAIGLPWRMLWYQFGPYEAYYELGRYEDIILLANATLQARPYFEESFYWRGRAYEALGNLDSATSDYQTAVNLQPNFTPAVEALGGDS